MYYVYQRSIRTEKEDFVGIYDSAEEAIAKIRACYNICKNYPTMENEYYFFMKEH